MIRFLLIFIFFGLHTCVVMAAERSFKFTLSTTAIYTNINDPRFSYKEEYEILRQPQTFVKSLSTGIAFKPLEDKHFSVNISTNRLTNWQTKRKVHDSVYGLDYDYRTKTIADTILFGYSIKRFLPQIFASNISQQRKLYFQNELKSNTQEHTILFGASLGYLLTKNLMVSSFILAPNKALKMEVGGGVGATLFF